MTPTQAQALINEFTSEPEIQQVIAEVLNYCAALSAAVALTHGFHEDEQAVRLQLAQAQGPDYRPWLSAQLLTAEFGRIMSEAGEAIESIRKPGPDDKCPEFTGWHVEAIDILVRVFDTLGKRGIKPGEIFVAKTIANNAREHKHGKNS